MINIDGSFGEGGGQILRTALSLSCHLKKPFTISNIRASRKNPGLMPQHIACVRAAQIISGAEVKGDSIGSSSLVFIPDNVRACHFNFDIGTAGSTSLVFQTMLTPLCFTDSESSIVITGGTHVPWSPPFHYLKYVFLPFLKNSGVDVNLEIERWGFYPKGGGIIKASIKPVKSLKSFNYETKGKLKTIKGLSAVSNLLVSIAERQKKSSLEILKEQNLNADIEILSAPGIGKGTFFFIAAEYEKHAGEITTHDKKEIETITAGFSSLGQIGKRAEDVGKEATEEFIKFHKSNAPVEKRLADQVLLYAALADKKSVFFTSEITKHLLTNIWAVEKFLDVKIEISGKEGEKGKIAVSP